MQIKHKHRFFYHVARVLPPVIAAFALLHMILYALGADMRGMDGLYGTSVTSGVFMLVMSLALGLCRIHRMCIEYSLVVSLSIKVNRWLTFGQFVEMVEAALIAMGVVIVSLAIARNCDRRAPGREASRQFKYRYRK